MSPDILDVPFSIRGCLLIRVPVIRFLRLVAAEQPLKPSSLCAWCLWRVLRNRLLPTRKHVACLGGRELQHVLGGVTMSHPKRSTLRALHEIAIWVVRCRHTEIDKAGA